MAVKQKLSANYRAVMRADRKSPTPAPAAPSLPPAKTNSSPTSIAAWPPHARLLPCKQPATAYDGYDDYIRGVQTMNDPVTGTSQHCLNEQYHWTDGYGNYRYSNDASYDPITPKTVIGNS